MIFFFRDTNHPHVILFVQSYPYVSRSSGYVQSDYDTVVDKDFVVGICPNVSWNKKLPIPHINNISGREALVDALVEGLKCVVSTCLSRSVATSAGAKL